MTDSQKEALAEVAFSHILLPFFWLHIQKSQWLKKMNYHGWNNLSPHLHFH